jgi:hypothetical protein
MSLRSNDYQRFVATYFGIFVQLDLKCRLNDQSNRNPHLQLERLKWKGTLNYEYSIFLIVDNSL